MLDLGRYPTPSALANALRAEAEAEHYAADAVQEPHLRGGARPTLARPMTSFFSGLRQASPVTRDLAPSLAHLVSTTVEVGPQARGGGRGHRQCEPGLVGDERRLVPAYLCKRHLLGRRRLRHWLTLDECFVSDQLNVGFADLHGAHDDREAYLGAAASALGSGAHLVMGTFGPTAPPRCSGLPVRRYDAAGLARTLGPAFSLREAREEEHVTPRGTPQPFTWTLFRRR